MLIEQIENVIGDLEIISDFLYQQKPDKGYERLNITLGQIVNIVDQLYILVQEQHLEYDTQNLLNSLTAAMEAMEAKDEVLLADILVYEIGGELLELIK